MEIFLRQISKENDDCFARMKHLSEEKRNLNIQYSNLRRELQSQNSKMVNNEAKLLKRPGSVLISRPHTSNIKKRTAEPENQGLFLITTVKIVTKRPEGAAVHGFQTPHKTTRSKTSHK